MFKTQHFVSTDERLVVTEADPAKRIVKEINGLPAAEEYARLVGVDVQELNSMRFAASPVVVMIDGTDYVRSIQKANADGSLTFFCAIEEGLVLRVAHGVDLVNNLEQTFDDIRAQISDHPNSFSAAIVSCGIWKFPKTGLKDRVGEIFRRNNTVGFNSYGEQFHGVHVNQTLTGSPSVLRRVKEEPSMMPEQLKPNRRKRTGLAGRNRTSEQNHSGIDESCRTQRKHSRIRLQPVPYRNHA